MTTFIVPMQVAKACYADPEYGPKLKAAETVDKMSSILVEYCRKHSLIVIEKAI